MFRTCVLSIPALALVWNFGAAPARGDEPKSDANPMITIKLREAKAGDKTTHTETEKGTSEITAGGMELKSKQETKMVYEEKIIDAQQGALKPTKLVRTYKTAQNYDA